MATTYSLDSCVRGYHVYKNIWTAPHGEILTCQNEFGNVEDPYAVAVVTQALLLVMCLELYLLFVISF